MSTDRMTLSFSTNATDSGITYELMNNGKEYVMICGMCQMPHTWHTKSMDKACYVQAKRRQYPNQWIKRLCNFRWWNF